MHTYIHTSLKSSDCKNVATETGESVMVSFFHLFVCFIGLVGLGICLFVHLFCGWLVGFCVLLQKKKNIVIMLGTMSLGRQR